MKIICNKEEYAALIRTCDKYDRENACVGCIIGSFLFRMNGGIGCSGIENFAEFTITNTENMKCGDQNV